MKKSEDLYKNENLIFSQAEKNIGKEFWKYVYGQNGVKITSNYLLPLSEDDVIILC